MWPGLCPHGPYYVHREADLTAIETSERIVMDKCEVPDCEPPLELGIAHCERQRCVAGRTPAPTSNKMESCWDYRETYLAAVDTVSETTVTAIQGITPRLVIVPRDAGKLKLVFEVPRDCTDCTLLISEHNSGMANLVKAKVVSQQDATTNGTNVKQTHLELPVTKGPYHIVGKSKSPAPYLLKVELLDSEGARGKVSRRGTSFVRMCEG